MKNIITACLMLMCLVANAQYFPNEVPKLIVRKSSNQSVNSGSNSFDVISFDDVLKDNFGVYLNDAYPVPLAGDYFVDANITWINNSGTSDDRMDVVITVNNLVRLSVSHDASDLIGSATTLTQGISGLIQDLQAGDIIQIQVFDADDVIIAQGEDCHLSIFQVK